MQSKILSRRDLEFLSYEWLDAEALTQRRRYADHSQRMQVPRVTEHDRELPKVQPQLDLLESIDTTALDMQDAWF